MRNRGPACLILFGRGEEKKEKPQKKSKQQNPHKKFISSLSEQRGVRRGGRRQLGATLTVEDAYIPTHIWPACPFSTVFFLLFFFVGLLRFGGDGVRRVG